MSSNREMVERLKSRGYIESDRVEQAFRKVDRKIFVPEELGDQAYKDRPQRIGEGQTISAPHMVAANTEILSPGESESVLEVGSGSGYQAAILGELSGEVTGIEIESALVQKSRDNLSELGTRNVNIVEGVGLRPVESSFDRILYSCAIDREEFERAGSYLKEEGKLVAPVKEGGSQVIKSMENREIEDHMRVRFVDYRE